MLEYKSVYINKILKKSIEQTINETLNEMTKNGWTFVQMSGSPVNGAVLIFSKEKFDF